MHAKCTFAEVWDLEVKIIYVKFNFCDILWTINYRYPVLLLKFKICKQGRKLEMVSLYVTLHRVLATFVLTRTRHVCTVRQKIEELSRNDRVRILLIKNFLCVGQHGRNNSLPAGKY